jgi:hypothetical protein
MGLPIGDGRQVDHINHNGLDNRRINLRLATNQQNAFNRQTNGVFWHKSKARWKAQLKLNGRIIFQRYFRDKNDAIEARTHAAKKHFGEFFNSPQSLGVP